MKKLILIIIAVVMPNVIYSQTETKSLEKILKNLNDIKTAAYYTQISQSLPGDTVFSLTMNRYVKMYANPADTLFGAKSIASYNTDFTRYNLCYDGKYRVTFHWRDKTAEIDTLTGKSSPSFMAPFFIRVKSLLEYTINHEDNIKISYKDFEDSARIYLNFPGRIAQFTKLNPLINQSPDKNSRYILWIDKDTNLPYKLTTKKPHQKVSTLCSDIKINKEANRDFDAIKKIPDDFSILSSREYQKKRIKTTRELRGEMAPNWKLKECNGDSVALDDINNKVILLHFTGIGSGPCHKAIPFLRNLKEEYRDKNFELFSIETFENIPGIKKYIEKNEINYRYLKANNKVRHKYIIHGVPTFFILNKRKEIKNVIVGYNKESTDKNITHILNEMNLQKN